MALPEDPHVQQHLDALWPELTPEQLLTELYTDTNFLAEVAPQLTDCERAALLRAAGGEWTASDVPLLDEAAELLGQDNRIDEERKARRRAKDIEYAQGVLDISSGSRAGEDDNPGAAERLGVNELIDAEYLAELQRTEDLRTLAEQAAADRTWSFGHVIVDEAQELSPMVWRLLVRRCPTRSFTIIGDIAQTGSVSGATTWQRALEPFFGTRWRMEQLLRLNSGCRAAGQAGRMVRPVSVRQPSMRWLRYWMCRRPLRTVQMRCSGVEKATLESQPRRRRDQMPSTGLRSGA
ncbi:hypothetical protein ELQ87_39160 [Streptomyces griseoviridis]|uniref:Uncharacterized protein n=1 Tax=Streptomyces griseoviridis TaxID=45398 RepID=A0A3S9ZNW6_STRGD|nr:hypothetical protein ELQ87_39160 [Streptomyces griseoviridis]QCN83562.1 hypothetical protein DDJ31_00075 [Streptomyces griseoviridis]